MNFKAKDRPVQIFVLIAKFFYSRFLLLYSFENTTNCMLTRPEPYGRLLRVLATVVVVSVQSF